MQQMKIHNKLRKIIFYMCVRAPVSFYILVSVCVCLCAHYNYICMYVCIIPAGAKATNVPTLLLLCLLL